jgi:glycosyltransferase involved in cell wall biosynthesis
MLLLAANTAAYAVEMAACGPEPLGSSAALITRDRDLGSTEPYPGLSGKWVRRGPSHVYYLNLCSARQWLQLLRQLRGTAFDLLYVNSLWAPAFTVIPIVAVRLGLIHAQRVLIAPRGELSPGALSLKSRKKRVFLRLWGPFLKQMDVTWHAFAEREASEICAVLPWARTEVNQNQIALPDEPLLPTPAEHGPARMVFIGRISAKKNLQLTLRALHDVTMPVDFDIYGPVEDDGYWLACRELIADLPPHVQVAYRGELHPDDVRRTFCEYDAFVFPTLGENFGHVIAESLSASCPVVCSDETPWSSILAAGGGAIVSDLASGSLAHELERIAAMTSAARRGAREAAGNAYRHWRRNTVGPNILEQIRCTSARSNASALEDDGVLPDDTFYRDRRSRG